MPMTHSDHQAIEALRLMTHYVPQPVAKEIQQTIRVWPMLHMGDRVRHYRHARHLSEQSEPRLRTHGEIFVAEQALHAQARLFLDA